MTRPLRILWAFSTFGVGGPQRRMTTLAEALGDGYAHAVTAMDGRYEAEDTLGDGVAYRRLELPVAKGGFVSVANLRTFRRALRDEAPDLLATCNWGCIEWLIANRGARAVPHVHFEDGFGPDERADAQNVKRLWTRRLAFRKGRTAFIAPSRVLEAAFTGPWRVPAPRVHLIPNGVDVTRFDLPARAPRSPLTIGTVAALRAEKRLDRLIGAFRRAALPDARLLIVGDGPERAALEAAAEGLPVTFAGAQADVVPWLAEMDAFAMSSDTEQMPIGLVEAMAARLPVAATDVGDTASMVAPEGRSLIVPTDEAALADALRKLGTDPALRARLGEANRARAVAAFSLDAMRDRYDALFRQMAGRGGEAVAG